MIEVSQVKKSYGDVEVLHGLDFTIEAGRPHAFLGRNGAGKTTFIRGFMDVFKFDSGKISVDGRPFSPWDFRVGYLPEERGMYQDAKILDQLLYFSKLRGVDEDKARENILDLLERMDLSYAKDNKLETLSKGNQQKVQLIQALMNHPDIIILDEPFSGLDPVNSQVLMDVINDILREDTYLIFSSHQMSHVEDMCEYLTMIDHGSIVLDGNIEELKTIKGRGKVYLKTPSPVGRVLDQRSLAYDREKNSYIINLEGMAKDDFLKILLEEKIEIDAFSNYRPSLDDIYIETVGD